MLPEDTVNSFPVEQQLEVHAIPSDIIERSPVQPTASLAEIAPHSLQVNGSRLDVVIPEWIPLDNYNPAQEPPSSSSKIFMPLETDYVHALPHLPPLPQASKRKRRGSKTEERKKDLAVLQLEYSLTPISGSLSKSTKCVLTDDWRVAEQELRHVRAMEKIDERKEAGRWSLRQPKKLRGPIVPKSYHDFLLEEMVSLGPK